MLHTQSPSLNDQDGEHDERNLDAAFVSSDRIRSLRRDTSHRSSGIGHSLLMSERPSIIRRIFRALARFSFVVLIGVGATLAWQSYGDQAEEAVRNWAPSIGWMLPVSTTKPHVLDITSAELQQQLKPMAVDLAMVRRSIEQLAANQDQLARNQEQIVQNIATLQSAEQQLSQKISPPPSKPVHVSPPKTPQPVAQ